LLNEVNNISYQKQFVPKQEDYEVFKNKVLPLINKEYSAEKLQNSELKEMYNQALHASKTNGASLMQEFLKKLREKFIDLPTSLSSEILDEAKEFNVSDAEDSEPLLNELSAKLAKLELLSFSGNMDVNEAKKFTKVLLSTFEIARDLGEEELILETLATMHKIAE
jgi:uncharacterized protein with von Willebrand factor type A (vWA) domain